MLFQIRRCGIQNVYQTLHKLYAGTPHSSYHSHGNICKVRMSVKPEAYLRIKNESDTFHLSFIYRISESNLQKQIHFNRDLSEPVSTFLNRLSAKVSQSLSARQKKKKKKDEQTAEIVVAANILKNGELVSGDTLCKDVFEEDDSTMELKVGDQNYAILKNHPWIETMTLPKSIMVGFPVYLCKFASYYTVIEESDFQWCKILPEGVEVVAEGPFYVPNVNDIGHKLMLKCVPKRNGIKGVAAEVTSVTAVEAGPGLCPFEVRHSFTDSTLAGDKFRVVSYNILADLYASSDTGRKELFSYCPPYALVFDYRKQLILKELLGYNADIVSLQEVDCRMFDVDLKHLLRSSDFEGVFSKKAGQVSEGVACFYRKSRFNLVSSHRVTLDKESCSEPCLQSIWNSISKNEVLYARMLERTTSLQVLVLDYSDKPGHKLVVANTHLYFHPKADHIRILQAGMCLQFVENLVKTLKSQDSSCKVSLVFCGDFNSTPECGVFELFTKNHIREDYPEWICENEAERLSGLALHNPIKFQSAYGTPEFTNYTPFFAGCLDYIYYDTENLKVDQVVPFPEKEEVIENIGIPSVVFPSDHLALVADLAWT